MTLNDYVSKQRGSAAFLARALGVPEELVSQWKTGARRVPAERCPQIERLTEGAVLCEEMRPDVEWDVLRLQAG